MAQRPSSKDQLGLEASVRFGAFPSPRRPAVRPANSSPAAANDSQRSQPTSKTPGGLEKLTRIICPPTFMPVRLDLRLAPAASCLFRVGGSTAATSTLHVISSAATAVQSTHPSHEPPAELCPEVAGPLTRAATPRTKYLPRYARYSQRPCADRRSAGLENLDGISARGIERGAGGTSPDAVVTG